MLRNKFLAVPYRPLPLSLSLATIHAAMPIQNNGRDRTKSRDAAGSDCALHIPLAGIGTWSPTAPSIVEPEAGIDSSFGFGAVFVGKLTRVAFSWFGLKWCHGFWPDLRYLRIRYQIEIEMRKSAACVCIT